MPNQPNKGTWKTYPSALVTCLTCGTQRWVPQSRSTQKYCDTACKFPLTELERFYTHVVCDLSTGCWLWAGAHLNNTGYGEFTIRGNGLQSTHRASWRLHNGPVPKGMNVCHRCDVRLCVRPAHLFLGTHRDNMADMRAKDRQSRIGYRPKALPAEAQPHRPVD